jgi:hypothetical protein
MRRVVLTVLVCGLTLGALGQSRAGAEVLITTEEAKLPASVNAAMNTRGLTRGPGIEQESPSATQSVTSPLPFKIKFEPRNNVPIDLASVKLVYLKATPVDLTERIKKHIAPDGITMDGAEVPPGVHLLRLDLKDAQGRVATTLIKITVADK